MSGIEVDRFVFGFETIVTEGCRRCWLQSASPLCSGTFCRVYGDPITTIRDAKTWVDTGILIGGSKI